MKTIRVVGMVLLCLALVFSVTGCGILADNIAPSTPIITKTTPDDDNTPNFTWDAATDDDSGIDRYEVNMDGGWIWIKVGNVTTYTWLAALSDGSHTFEVKAIDNAGNVGVAASLTFTIDTTSSDLH